MSVYFCCTGVICNTLHFLRQVSAVLKWRRETCDEVELRRAMSA